MMKRWADQFTGLFRFRPKKALQQGIYKVEQVIYARALNIKPIILDSTDVYRAAYEATCFDCGRWECSCD